MYVNILKIRIIDIYIYMENTMDNTLDVTERVAEPVNNIGAVVFVLRNHRFNLTRQVLIDSCDYHGQHTFFYHILTLDPDEFNEKYGRHAYFQNVEYGTANILLNMNISAFEYIVDCLELGFIKFTKLHYGYMENTNINVDMHMEITHLENILDMTAIFGMDKFRAKLSNEIMNRLKQISYV